MTTSLFKITVSAFALSFGVSFAQTQEQPNKISFESIRLPHANALISRMNLEIKPVIVAVIDSGISVFHPQLQGKIAINHSEVPSNGKDDDKNGLTDDYLGYDFTKNTSFQVDPDGHGTHVAGIITQVNPMAQILALRVLGDDGNGSAENVSRAIRYAVDRGAKVINLSLGAADTIGKAESSYEPAIKYARQKNVLVLAAAGNNYGSDNDKTAFFPANTWDDNVMSICSNNVNGSLSDFSNWGKWRVHLCAPGENILSANSKYNALNGKPQMVYLSGTSQATPIVSGVASLIYGLNPDLKPHQVRDILMSTAGRSQALKGKSQTGGILNAESALFRTLSTKL